MVLPFKLESATPLTVFGDAIRSKQNRDNEIETLCDSARRLAETAGYGTLYLQATLTIPSSFL